MRKTLFAAVAAGAVALLALVPNHASASWLSQWLHWRFDPYYYAVPHYGPEYGAYYPPYYGRAYVAPPSYGYSYYAPDYDDLPGPTYYGPTYGFYPRYGYYRAPWYRYGYYGSPHAWHEWREHEEHAWHGAREHEWHEHHRH